ncbi:MAG: cob(I)yrinic acid a,c-diamide adenosyltransferase [Candidatus Aminicenantes bacterium]|nr:cob(I)yrinic acid a,c-diamide adenosyltransferase [Candidatus Aminicenantes bacterium]MCJ7486795.1 cob(I)yrinic acid a,c-diamide adenosyltransferase [Candidatus Aminicenantes bacterium]TFG54256.1 MAG: cob(I)yrinic acid a,c-diamide adenosyltransferase [Candidatus Aminicenantes bacterium]
MDGYIQVYTGDGKGKTTAALGLALRAAGHGMRTYFGQFLKGQHYGEIDAAKKLSPLIRIERFGREGFLHITEGPDDEDIRRAKEGLQKCREAMLSGNYQIVVLDEVNTAVLLKVLTVQDVLDFLALRPDSVELVLTGRGAPQAVVDRADLVTEMKNVKHYYDRGVKAREGIEK